MILDKDGNVIDWISRYTPPSANWKAKLQKSLDGVDTVRGLSDLYAKDPKNVPTVFKLALKYENQYDMRDKAREYFQKILALDSDGKAGVTEIEGYQGKIGYTEYAALSLAQEDAYGEKPDPSPVRSFINKYPQSPLLQDAYSTLSYYYSYMAPKDEAVKFFEEYISRFPNDPYAYNSYIQRIIREKGPVDKGLELADKVKELTKYSPVPYFTQQRADLYWLKDDKEMADAVYGSEYAKGEVSRLTSSLTTYARFWAEKGENLASAEEAIATVLKLQPELSYARSTAASIALKQGKEDKALEIFGPDFARKNEDNAANLYSYAYFWNREGKNLASALEAARKSAELEPWYYKFDILGQIHEKLNNLPDALKAAEKALELARETAKTQTGFPTKRYEDRVNKIKDAMAKVKGGEAKK